MRGCPRGPARWYGEEMQPRIIVSEGSDARPLQWLRERAEVVEAAYDTPAFAAELERAHLLYRRPHLPQGAPTSPALANLCAFRLDRRLSGLAEAAGARYTRYADDLAFSGDVPFGRMAERFSVQVAAIVAEEGFSVAARKKAEPNESVLQLFVRASSPSALPSPP